MLSVKIQRVFLATHKVDFRKRFDGLLSESYQLGANPYYGDCVIFIKRDRTQLRAIVGDSAGLYLICRRFDGGRMQKLASWCDKPSIKAISNGELSLLLEGATYSVHGRVKSWCSSKARQSTQEITTK